MTKRARRKRNQRKSIPMPDWIGEIVDQVNADDKAYFARTGHTYRIRPYTPNEEGALAVVDPPDYVLVTRLADGVRLRQFKYGTPALPATIVDNN